MKTLIKISALVLMAVFAVTCPILLFASSGHLAMATAIDVSAVTAYADEHKRPLIASLINGLDIANDITVIPNVKNKVALSKLTIGDGFRPYSGTHEPKTGQLVFADRYLETLTGKRDLLIDVKDFKTKHLAWRTRPGNAASKTIDDMDFAPFVWDRVIKGLQREINDETAYYGFDKSTAVAYDSGDAYAVNDIVTFSDSSFTSGVTEYFLCIATASAGDTPATDTDKWRNVTARAVVPGIKSYIDAAITGGFTATTTGAITTGATAQTAFKKLFRDFSAAYKSQMVIIHASYTDCEFLLDGMETITQYTSPDVSAMVKMGLIPIMGTNNKCFAKPASWLGTSRRLIAEPMEISNGGYGLNLVMGTDLLSDANDINMIKDVYTLKTGITVDLGFQIQDLSALRLGNQA